MSALGDKLRAMAEEAREADALRPYESGGEGAAAFDCASEMADEAIAPLEAEVAELRAEVAAYQGRPEGALPGWEPMRGTYQRIEGSMRMTAHVHSVHGSWWGLYREGAWLVDDVMGRTPRAAMRACEDAARARGWLS